MIREPPNASSIGEPHLADLLATLAETSKLEAQLKRHWASSIRQVCTYIGRPPESLPARMTGLSSMIARLHPERLKVNPKTFANHRANLRAAVVWFGQGSGGLTKPPMGADYRELIARLESRHDRDLISPFLRYLTARDVKTCDVNDGHIDGYKAFVETTRFRPLQRHHQRRIARLWNKMVARMPDEPFSVLTVAKKGPASNGCDLTNMPEGLRNDINRYLQLIRRRHRSADGRTMRGCAEVTIAMRRRELDAVIRRAVACGIPLGTMTSLAELVRPATAALILEAYWEQHGDKPSAFAIELASRFVAMAQLMALLTPPELEELKQIRSTLETHRQRGLTDKNRAVVRAVLGSNIWQKVVDLPARILAEVSRRKATAPQRAAVEASLAIAIRILAVAPIRIKNLASIRIHQHLVRPDGPGTSYVLWFSDHEVKNRETLEIPLDPATSKMIDDYIINHRPALMSGHNHELLFPGKVKDGKASQALGEQITKKIWKAVGLRCTSRTSAGWRMGGSRLIWGLSITRHRFLPRSSTWATF